MFIKLTNAHNGGIEYVNIFKAETIGVCSQGSIICFGGVNNYILVKETPEEVLNLFESME